MALSRYRNVNVLNQAGEEGVPRHFETTDFPTASDLEQVPTFKIVAAQFDRLDQLAFKHLGAGEYWWIIALMNDIDWMYDFTPGQILRIPVNVEDVLRLV